MAIAAPVKIAIHLRIFLRRFISGFLEIDSQLVDHLLEPEYVLAGVGVVGSARHEPLVYPLPGKKIGDGSNVGGDLRGLTGNGRRTEHNRESTIDRVIDPEINHQAGKHSGGDRERETVSPPGLSGCVQLTGHGRQHSMTKLRLCAAGCHAT